MHIHYIAKTAHPKEPELLYTKSDGRQIWKPRREFYATVLLRASYRDGRQIRKRTILNLTKWSIERIQRLEAALKIKRDCRGTILEGLADSWILSIVCDPPDQPHHFWTVYNALDSYGKRHYARPE